jgi:multiple sugar transport system ATP-binding protein
MIYVTHDPLDAMILGDRVVVLESGRVQQVGRPLAVYDRPANRFVAGFFGSPPMNLVDGQLTADGGVFRPGAAGEPVLPVPARVAARWAGHSGQAVTLGIRPQDVHWAVSSSEGPVLPMTAERMEPLGSMTLVTLRHGEWRLTAELSGRSDVKEGASLTVGLDMEHAHLFDGVTGQALCARPEG